MTKKENIKIYLVGGAVRDEILGQSVKDRDWVVTGATPEIMIERGFYPVGSDFPVFLHPKTNEEYAMARTERKTAPGYKGFLFHTDSSVSLEDDLMRRDLTINAMAKTAEGMLIDLHGGANDIKNKVFRHVSQSFAEDPVRILRVARLAARYPDFTVAPETVAIMRQMVDNGEVDALVPERIWKEISRGLQDIKPSRMLQVLRQCGALKRILPEVDCLYGVPAPAQWHPEIDTGIHVEMVLDYAAKVNAPLSVRFAGLVHDLGKGLTKKENLPSHHSHEANGVALVEAVCSRLKVPNEYSDLAKVVTKEHGNVHASTSLNGASIMRLLERFDAIRQPDRFRLALLACDCDARGRLGFENRHYPQPGNLARAIDVALAVNTRDVSAAAIARGKKGPAIGEDIRRARMSALSMVFGSEKKLSENPRGPN